MRGYTESHEDAQDDQWTFNVETATASRKKLANPGYLQKASETEHLSTFTQLVGKRERYTASKKSCSNICQKLTMGDLA